MSNIPDSEFYDEFESFALKLDDSAETLEKLRSICGTYGLTAGDLTCELVAVKSTLKKTLSVVTVDFLEQFERELNKKNKNKNAAKTPNSRKSLADLSSSRNSRLMNNTKDESDSFMDSYCSTPSGKGTGTKRSTGGLSPGNLDDRPSKRTSAYSTGVTTTLSGSQPFSPCNTPSAKYNARTNKGEVVCRFGAEEGLSRKGKGGGVTVLPYDTKSHLNRKYNYMVQKNCNTAAILDEIIEDMGQLYKDRGVVEYYSYLVVPVQDTVPVVGRICCDGNGKLNPRSILLEGSRDRSGGMTAFFDVSSVPQYSFFPGQIVVAEGTNVNGKSFSAKTIHKGLCLPSADLPKLNQEITILIAAGPYTTSDNISYDPLDDLLTVLSTNTPDLCILFGPFVDVKQPLVENGKIDISYEELFEHVMKRITEVTQKHSIHVVVVPSGRDVHHECVYPQPPFVCKTNVGENVTLVPDPCTLSVNGLVIGLTSADILFHLGAEETFSSAAGAPDRISRLIEHVLTQHTYYPLYPPSAEINLDLEHFDLYARLPVTPHVLLLPSDLRPFIKSVGDSVCVNPGHLVKGQVGGTFALLSIKPCSDVIGENTSVEAESIVTMISGEVHRI